jgi:hypothetical protein
MHPWRARAGVSSALPSSASTRPPPEASSWMSKARRPGPKSKAGKPVTAGDKKPAAMLIPCTLCDKSFRLENKLQRHLLEVHVSGVSVPAEGPQVSDGQRRAHGGVQEALVKANAAMQAATDPAGAFCPVCAPDSKSKRFKTAVDMASHIISKHCQGLSDDDDHDGGVAEATGAAADAANGATVRRSGRGRAAGPVSEISERVSTTRKRGAEPVADGYGVDAVAKRTKLLCVDVTKPGAVAPPPDTLPNPPRPVQPAAKTEPSVEGDGLKSVRRGAAPDVRGPPAAPGPGPTPGGTAARAAPEARPKPKEEAAASGKATVGEKRAAAEPARDAGAAAVKKVRPFSAQSARARAPISLVTPSASTPQTAPAAKSTPSAPQAVAAPAGLALSASQCAPKRRTTSAGKPPTTPKNLASASKAHSGPRAAAAVAAAARPLLVSVSAGAAAAAAAVAAPVAQTVLAELRPLGGLSTKIVSRGFDLDFEAICDFPSSVTAAYYQSSRQTETASNGR